MLTDTGIFVSLMGSSATFIIVFCIFGAFAVESGAGGFFTEFARAIAGHTREALLRSQRSAQACLAR